MKNMGLCLYITYFKKHKTYVTETTFKSCLPHHRNTGIQILTAFRIFFVKFQFLTLKQEKIPIQFFSKLSPCPDYFTDIFFKLCHFVN